jgi:glyoxylase-like metal-dependent hydrolase (beta-lactamase superfamily II)
MLQVKFFPFNAFSENTYIISNEKKNAIIIDPGNFLPREDSAFFDYIEQNELKPTQIINTHCHLDHVLGVHACKEKYQIPFSFHATEQQVLDWAPEAAMRYGVPMVHSPKADFYIKEGDNIMLDDDKLKIIGGGGVKIYRTDLLIFTNRKEIYAFNNIDTEIADGDYLIPSKNLVFKLD